MKAHRFVAAPLALTLALAGCIGGRGGAGSGYLVGLISGLVEVLREGSWRPLAEGESVGPGSAVRVHRGGTVAMEHGADAGVELRTEREVPAQITIASPDHIEIESGDVLVTSTPSAPIEVSSGGIRARAPEAAIFRFDRQLSVRVGVYDGSAVVASPAGNLQLARFREGVIAGRVVPRVPEPLRIDPDDPWDERLLADVIALDSALAAQQRGYEAEFGRRMRAVAPLRAIAPGRTLAFLRPYATTATSGDIFIGLVLSLVAEQRGAGAAPGLFRQLMGLLERGATWGLLAHELGVPAAELTDAVVRAIGLRTGEVRRGTSLTPEPSPTSTGGAEPEPTQSSGKPTTRPKPSPSERPTEEPTEEPTESPSPSPSPSEDPSCFPGPPPLCAPPT